MSQCQPGTLDPGDVRVESKQQRLAQRKLVAEHWTRQDDDQADVEMVATLGMQCTCGIPSCQARCTDGELVSFWVPSGLLSAASPVFKEALESTPDEGENHVVDLHEFGAPVLQNVLRQVASSHPRAVSVAWSHRWIHPKHHQPLDCGVIQSVLPIAFRYDMKGLLKASEHWIVNSSKRHSNTPCPVSCETCISLVDCVCQWEKCTRGLLKIDWPSGLLDAVLFQFSHQTKAKKQPLQGLPPSFVQAVLAHALARLVIDPPSASSQSQSHVHVHYI